MAAAHVSFHVVIVVVVAVSSSSSLDSSVLADKLLVARLMLCIIFAHLSIVNASGSLGLFCLPCPPSPSLSLSPLVSLSYLSSDFSRRRGRRTLPGSRLQAARFPCSSSLNLPSLAVSLFFPSASTPQRLFLALLLSMPVAATAFVMFSVIFHSAIIDIFQFDARTQRCLLPRPLLLMLAPRPACHV